jgi:hypothetical protein
MKMTLESLRNAVGRSWKNMHAVCALRSCRNTMLISNVPQRRIGIQVGRLWYCSVDCFADAAHLRLTELSDERIVEMPHRPRQPIGLVMLSKGFLSGDQLRYATAQSRRNGEPLEDALLRLGLANERQLAAARAAQWGCPLLKQERPGLPVETDIPATLLRAATAVPLHYSAEGGRLLLGFVYRVEHTLLHAVEQVIGCRTEPCFITPTELEARMAQRTTAASCEEQVFDEPGTPAQMANVLGGLAVDAGAREVSFVNCRDYIWTRITGKRRRVDVLFRARRSAGPAMTENFFFQEENISTWG